LALEGVALELARLEPGAAAAAGELRPTPEAYAAADREDLVARYFALEREFHSERGRLTAELAGAEQRRRELEDLLRRVERSPSFRLGRALTAPVRALRSLLSRRPTSSRADRRRN
jgi:hypothetical protein